jgi:flagellar basal-body rod protein FlgB
MDGMSNGIFSDSNYALARKMLDYSAMRQEALASNLANYEVPGYKRVDVALDFQRELRKAVESGSSERMSSIVPTVEIDKSAVSSRMDGNNVEMDKEMMEVNRNAIEYEYLTRYVNNNYQMMRGAITSQS